MSDEDKSLKQRLSMFMDSELEADANPRLLEKLANEESLKSVWDRYHLIGEVIRNPNAVLVNSEFAECISKAVQSEPTVVAFGRRRFQPNNIRNKAIMFALAASMAAIAVFVGKSIDEKTNFYQLAKSEFPSLVGAPHRSREESLATARFNDYLVTHNETAAMTGSAVMLPRVRLVSARADH